MVSNQAVIECILPERESHQQGIYHQDAPYSGFFIVHGNRTDCVNNAPTIQAAIEKRNTLQATEVMWAGANPNKSGGLVEATSLGGQ